MAQKVINSAWSKGKGPEKVLFRKYSWCRATYLDKTNLPRPPSPSPSLLVSTCRDLEETLPPHLPNPQYSASPPLPTYGGHRTNLTMLRRPITTRIPTLPGHSHHPHPSPPPVLHIPHLVLQEGEKWSPKDNLSKHDVEKGSLQLWLRILWWEMTLDYPGRAPPPPSLASSQERGRDWSDVARSQGWQAYTRPRKRWGMNTRCLRAAQGGQPCRQLDSSPMPLGLASWPPERWEQTSLLS